MLLTLLMVMLIGVMVCVCVCVCVPDARLDKAKPSQSTKSPRQCIYSLRERMECVWMAGRERLSVGPSRG